MPEKPIFVRGRLSPQGVERLRGLFRLCYRLFCDVEVHGLEKVPPGGVIVCPNHLSRFDPPLIFMSMPNRKSAVFNADTYRRNPLFRPVMESIDVIWVNRGATTPSAIKAAIRVLEEGAVLGLAPEGTRSRTQGLQLGKTGAAYLAYAAGVPVVPAAITNTHALARAILSFRRSRLTLTFGQPIWFGQPGRRTRPTAEQLEQATTEIMCRIAAMLPPDYHGAYAGHPRLRELLETLPQQI